uniref:Reverse transcriptase domain-containing protein n=1 Tax=Nicotiana tabacum TaxID=4097 RepID=A0A1S3YCQ1_TOBAC
GKNHVLIAIKEEERQQRKQIVELQTLCGQDGNEGRANSNTASDKAPGIGSDKAPSIDGYNAEFFKKAWPVIKEKVYAAVKEFFHTGVMFLAINCTTITLLQKVPNRVTIEGFGPIACCTVLYKLISKVIASRLQKIMPCIISEAHANIYASPQNSITGVRTCVSSVSYSIMINGELTKPFEAAKVLRQGDPISPFLFAITMEYLSRLLKRLKQAKEYRFHPRYGKLDIAHLSFVDDLLMFARGDSKSVSSLHAFFMQFSTTSGLLANLNKSAIYFWGVAQDTK